LVRERSTFARVEFDLAHQEVGLALVEQVLNQTNGAPGRVPPHKAIKRRLPMELVLIIIVVMLVFGGGGYWGRGRGYW
jgi:hypothetical protein